MPPRAKQQRGNSFAFTYHYNEAENLTLDDCEQNLRRLPCSYIIFSYEMGKEDGRIHIQGFMSFATQTAFSGIHKHCPGIWIEKARASAAQNIAYVSKLDTHVAGPFEFGSRPCQGYRSDLVVMGDMIKEGKTPDDVVMQIGLSAARIYKHLQTYSSVLISRPRDFTPKVFVRYGPSGIGKTKWVYDTYKTVYALTYKKNSIWWDGYANQECILIDDWPLIADEDIYNNLLVWCDRYPAKVNFKGGMVNLGASDIVITSNDPPATWFGGRGLRALARRITDIKNMDDHLEYTQQA